MQRASVAVVAVLLAAVVAGVVLTGREEAPSPPSVAAAQSAPAPVANVEIPQVEMAAVESEPASPLPDSGTDAGAEGDDAENARARDSAACDIVDGVPNRAGEDEVAVEIRGAATVSGTLVVRYLMSAGLWTTPDGRLHGNLSKTARVSHQRVTLLRCRDRAVSLQLDLDDGSLGRAEHEKAAPSVVLVVVRTALVKGRLVAEGKGFAGAQLVAWTDKAVGAATTDREGRFEMRIPTEKAEKFGSLTMMDDVWRFAVHSPRLEYEPGATLDLGDLPLQRKPPTRPGFIGVGIEDVNGEATIVHVSHDTPAARAGLAPHDVLIEVDGAAVRTRDEAIRRIPGDAGTHVRLKVRRGTEYLLFDLTRQSE